MSPKTTEHHDRVALYPLWMAMGSAVFGVVMGGAAVYLALEGRHERAALASSPAITSAESICCEGPVAPAAASGPSLIDAVARTRDTVVTLRSGSALLGAGVIINASGVLLTNYHVIAPLLGDSRRDGLARARGSQLIVRLANGRELPAALLLGEREHDVALLRLKPADSAEIFPAARLGRSATLAVGAPVFAVGTPMGLEHSVSSGIVSALDRTHVLANRRLSLIQIDASINFGSSGGPLFDLDGALVGITTAMVERAQGIGFAIPIDHVVGLLRAIDEGGGARRSGRIGVEALPATELSDATYRLGYRNGLVIDAVDPGSPADAAGLRSGDVIVELRGRRFDALGSGVEARKLFGASFVDVVRSLMPKERLEITVVRGEEAVALSLEIAAANAEEQARIDAEELLGLQLDPTGQIRGIVQGSEIAAWRGSARLRGARITSVIGRPVATIEALGAALADLRQVVTLGRRSAISVTFALSGGGSIVVENFPISLS
jgi:S1-C subfamily serine protease